MRWVGLAAAMAVIALAGCTAKERTTGPTTADLLKQMKEKWAGIGSFEMDEKITTTYEDGSQEQTEVIHLAGERTQIDGKTVVRGALVGKLEVKTREGKTSVEEAKFVNDGINLWEEMRDSEQEGEIHVKKYALAKAAREGFPATFEWGPRLIEENAKRYDLKVMDEETIDGRKMSVLEGSAKKPEGTASTRKFWIDEGSMFIRRTVFKSDNKKGEAITATREVSNVKVNEKVDEKMFEYAPPAGAKVEDKTGQ